MSSPTSRSLVHLRKEGWEPWVVEKWKVRGIGRKYHGRSLFVLEVREDLYNFADIIAMQPGEGFVAVQTTSGSCVSARIKKILAEEKALTWLQSGGRIIVHGWRKVKVKRGGKLMVWRPRIEEITEEMFDEQS